MPAMVTKSQGQHAVKRYHLSISVSRRAGTLKTRCQHRN